jgi:hypothetical protein
MVMVDQLQDFFVKLTHSLNLVAFSPPPFWYMRRCLKRGCRRRKPPSRARLSSSANPSKRHFFLSASSLAYSLLSFSCSCSSSSTIASRSARTAASRDALLCFRAPRCASFIGILCSTACSFIKALCRRALLSTSASTAFSRSAAAAPAAASASSSSASTRLFGGIKRRVVSQVRMLYP